MTIDSAIVLPPYEVAAKNYGAKHANKIHSDAGAAEHGFAGALVPGVAMYAYLTRPVVDALGPDWLRRGAISAKFVHPIYDGERVRAEAQITNSDPLVIALQLVNSTGELCAVGSATMPTETQSLVSLPNLQNYPARALPPEDARWPATIAAINSGDIFDSLDFTLNLTDGVAQFLEDMVDGSPLYRGTNAVCHPAFWLAQANEVFMRNIALGMWIHTASQVQHLALAEDGERLSLRGRVADTNEKRGHEILTADLAIFGEADRVIAQIKHTAIIRLKT